MKNLLNCHCKGLHSFPLSFENGLYRRVFLTTRDHDLWKPFELAIHPHHVDIKIIGLVGTVYNLCYKETEEDGGIVLNKFQWDSHIKSGAGGFTLIGEADLVGTNVDIIRPKREVVMPACKLHTISVDIFNEVAWLIEESVPTCEYFPFNYSTRDLSKWTPNGLYQEVDNSVRDEYFKKFGIEYLIP